MRAPGHARDDRSHSITSVRRVAIFAPQPLLSITIENRGAGEDEIHLHAAGQGVWVARMAAELGAEPVLCAMLGGETGEVLGPLLGRLTTETRPVKTAGDSGCYVQDHRGPERRLVTQSLSPPPSRHEVDELVSTTCAAAVDSNVLVVCNPFPGDALPLDVYRSLVTDVSLNGTPVLVDLSSPRLDSALEGNPDLVKLNDWELAQFVSGPVSTAAELRAAGQKLLDAGAKMVVVTRGGEPALVLRGDEAWELVPPHFERGFPEGCGDTMMGGIAAALASGADWQRALITGAAAGAANFLRRGLGSGSDQAVEDLIPHTTLTSLAQA